MAKVNILFNGTDYLIDEAALEQASTELKTHLSSAMNGSGATINFGGVSYNVDSTKLSNATNNFVSHLGTISGSGSKVIINGVEYSVDSAKVSDAISEMETVFSQFVENFVSENLVVGDSVSGGGTVRLSSVGYRGGRKPILHENSVIEVVIDGITIICPLDGVKIADAYTVIGSYHDFKIQIGEWRINAQTGLYAPKVIVPDNATSVAYKYPSVDETIEATE
jgi:hypothetical protein